MNVHEYQAKELLKRYGVAVPVGQVAFTAEEAAAAFQALQVPLCAVKSQIHAGGRGKGKCYDVKDRSRLVLEGGVKLARSSAEARDYASKLLRNVLVTHQTGPAGRVVNRVYVETGSRIARELYLSIVVDRGVGLPLLLASTEGGMEIEEVAAQHPERILKLHFDPREGLWPHQARRVAYFLGLSGDTFKSGTKFLAAMARAFCELDCSLAEINPLVVTQEGREIGRAHV
jgi:succinyl-CoA synthetase beta subunit